MKQLNKSRIERKDMKQNRNSNEIAKTKGMMKRINESTTDQQTLSNTENCYKEKIRRKLKRCIISELTKHDICKTS